MIDYSTVTLSNGLKVISNHDPDTAMVAVNIIYNVGSRDEDPELTGIAHLFEHLMFGGSRNIPSFDSEVDRASGTSNAWTSNDFTSFYVVVPAVNAEAAFRLESDRMLEPLLSGHSLEVQKGVVIEEFKQMCLNRPYGDLMHHLRAMAYKTHPYRFPVIGKEPGHIERVTGEDARNWFFTHYSPQNAVLAVSGNITHERVREWAEKWFGDIPRRTVAPRLYGPEGPVESPREVTVSGRVAQPALTVAFPMGGYGSADYLPCDMITDMLGAGRSARLLRNLVMKDPLFTVTDASITGSEEPGLLMLNARLSSARPADIERARRRLVEEALRFATEPPIDMEMTTARNRYEANHEFGLVGFLAKAQALAMAGMHGEDINAAPARYRAVSSGEISSAAARVIDENRAMTLVYLPQ